MLSLSQSPRPSLIKKYGSDSVKNILRILSRAVGVYLFRCFYINTSFLDVSFLPCLAWSVTREAIIKGAFVVNKLSMSLLGDRKQCLVSHSSVNKFRRWVWGGIKGIEGVRDNVFHRVDKLACSILSFRTEKDIQNVWVTTLDRSFLETVRYIFCQAMSRLSIAITADVRHKLQTHCLAKIGYSNLGIYKYLTLPVLVFLQAFRPIFSLFLQKIQHYFYVKARSKGVDMENIWKMMCKREEPTNRSFAELLADSRRSYQQLIRLQLGYVDCIDWGSLDLQSTEMELDLMIGPHEFNRSQLRNILPCQVKAGAALKMLIIFKDHGNLQNLVSSLCDALTDPTKDPSKPLIVQFLVNKLRSEIDRGLLAHADFISALCDQLKIYGIGYQQTIGLIGLDSFEKSKNEKV